MATKTKEPKGGAKGGAKGSAQGGAGGGKVKKEKGGSKAAVAAPRGPHAGAGLPVPAPRLKDYYLLDAGGS